MIKSLILSLFFILLLLPIVYSEENIKTLNDISPSKDIGFAIYQFDIFRCYQYNEGRYSNDIPLAPIKLNESMSNSFLDSLREIYKKPQKIAEITIEEDKFYNHTYSFDYFVKNQYGDVVGFTTDGYWWTLYFIKDNISLSNYTLLEDYHRRVALQTMDYVKIYIASSYEGVVSKTFKKDVNCEMESGDRYNVYFSAYNFFVKDYFDDLGCSYSNNSIMADCENSEVFKLIPKNSAILNREVYRSKPTSYKIYNSFVILNKDDIRKAQRDYDFDLLGSRFIITEYPVFDGFWGGHSSYMNMVEYFKNLKDIELKNKKIDKLNSQIISKSGNVTNILSKANDITYSDVQSDLKQKKLKNLNRENFDFSTQVKDKLSSLTIDIINKERYFNREKEQFYGQFYHELTDDYINNYKISLNELKLNLDYYHDNLRYLHSYLTQINLNIQFQADSEKQRKENSQSLLVTSVLALFAVFSSMIIFFIDNIIRKYGYRVFILYITSQLSIIILVFILSLVILKFFFDIPNNTYFLINFTILLSFLTYYTILYWHDSKFVRDECFKQLKSNSHKKRQVALEILIQLLISAWENKEFESYNNYIDEIRKLLRNPPKNIKRYIDQFMAKIFTYYRSVLPKEDIDKLLKILQKSKLPKIDTKINTKLTEEGKSPKLEVLVNEKY